MARTPKDSEKKANFKTNVNPQPEMLSPEQFIKHFNDAMENLKKLEQEQRGRRSVELVVTHNDPIQLILAGDLHLGSFATNKEMCDNLLEYLLKTPNAILVLLGDQIEGFKAAYAATNVATSMPGLSNQIDYFYHYFFKPLADAGKIAGMVTGYWGHEGWVNDATTLNIGAVLTRHHPDIPLIANGGTLTVRFENGQKVDTKIFHNPSGTSKNDPVYGLRNAAQTVDPAARSDVYTSGHIHRAAVVSESYPGLTRVVNLVQGGTPKSSVDGDNTDAFGERLGLSSTDPWLQSVVIRPQKGRRGTPNSSSEIIYPAISAAQGELVLAALELLNSTEADNTTGELLGQIYNEFPSPTAKVNPQRSRVTSSPADLLLDHSFANRKALPEDKQKEGQLRPLYEKVAWRINTQLPITVYPVSNVRFGSWHESKPNLAVEEYMREVAKDPYAYAIYLRNIIAKDTATQPERLQTLERFINFIKTTEGHTLGVLLDDGLGSKSWLKRMGKTDDARPLAAGSHVSAETGAKLLHHLSTLNLSVGPNEGFANNVQYPFQLIDRMLGHGSFNSTSGTMKMYKLYSSSRPAVMVGGHMPVSGVGQFYDNSNQFTRTPVLISPGWWSSFVDTTGTRSKGGLPGQAVILIPGAKQSESMLIPTSTADQTELLSRALTLYFGAELLGLIPKLAKNK